MDRNIAAWMIAGGPRIEDPHAARDREQLHAFRESQRVSRPARIGLVERVRSLVQPKPAEPVLDCCTA
jgi:hypothetical protein